MRRISRRSLIGTGVAAGLLAAAPVAAASAPGRGTLRLAVPGDILPFDGRLPFGPAMRILGQGSVFDCLTEIAADGTIAGELAESWSPAQGGRVWRVVLRDGVSFHDGQPFGPDDVVETLRQHLDATPRSAGHPPLAGVASVRRAGPRGVDITLRTADPGFPLRLADPQLIVRAAADIRAGRAVANGTGLFRRDDAAEDGRATLTRVATHYKGDSAGRFDRIEVISIADPRDRAAALSTGRVDAATGLAAADLRKLTRTGRFRAFETPGAHMLWLSAEAMPTDAARDLLAAVAARFNAPDSQPRPCLDAVRLAADGAAADWLPRLHGAAAALSLRHDPAAAPTLRLLRLPAYPTDDWGRDHALWRPDGAPLAVDAIPLATLSDAAVVSSRLGRPPATGGQWELDHARIGERWWRL